MSASVMFTPLIGSNGTRPDFLEIILENYILFHFVLGLVDFWSQQQG